MDRKSKASEKPEYEDFEPLFEWTSDAGSNTLALDISGFKKEELKVQIDNAGNLKIRGERDLGINKWKRFDRTFRLPENCNFDEIRAKFDEGLLYIVMPKVKEAIKPDKPLQSQQQPAPVKTPVETKIDGIRKYGDSKIVSAADAGKPKLGLPEKKDEKSGGSVMAGKVTQVGEEKLEKGSGMGEKKTEKAKGPIDAGKFTGTVTEKVDAVKEKWKAGADIGRETVDVVKEKWKAGAEIWPEKVDAVKEKWKAGADIGSETVDVAKEKWKAGAESLPKKVDAVKEKWKAGADIGSETVDVTKEKWKAGAESWPKKVDAVKEKWKAGTGIRPEKGMEEETRFKLGLNVVVAVVVLVLGLYVSYRFRPTIKKDAD